MLIDGFIRIYYIVMFVVSCVEFLEGRRARSDCALCTGRRATPNIFQYNYSHSALKLNSQVSTTNVRPWRRAHLLDTYTIVRHWSSRVYVAWDMLVLTRWMGIRLESLCGDVIPQCTDRQLRLCVRHYLMYRTKHTIMRVCCNIFSVLFYFILFFFSSMLHNMYVYATCFVKLLGATNQFAANSSY